jgi:hypothetical protein
LLPVDAMKRLLPFVLLVAGCEGLIGERHGEGAVVDETHGLAVAESGARRLTRREVVQAVRDLFGVDVSDAMNTWPQDFGAVFDNDYTRQLASEQLVVSAELLAETVAARVVADPALRAAVMPCTPTGPTDAACFRNVVQSLGRRALRRHLAADETELYAPLLAYASEAPADFYSAVELVIRVLVQHPEFIYRVEIGRPVSGDVRALSEDEIATRLSFLLWGSVPDDALFADADAGSLSDAARRREIAARMLGDARAQRQIERFHAQWLAYANLSHTPERTAMYNRESAALVSRVLFEERGDYLDLFRSPRTFVNDELAAIYGLPLTGTDAWRWVDYGATGRRGLLSHGSVLAAPNKFADTSPVQRGLYVRTRLMCDVVAPPPPDLMVNVDMPPESEPGDCKSEVYTMHSTGQCSSCHAQIDPIGFGLEQYDREGRVRTHETGRPECGIDGVGEVQGLGAFSGAGELGELLAGSGLIERCATRQLYRFALGRQARVAERDRLESIAAPFAAEGRDFLELLLALVEDPSFALVRLEDDT